jgi:hypothetical protein
VYQSLVRTSIVSCVGRYDGAVPALAGADAVGDTIFLREKFKNVMICHHLSWW